MRPWLAAFLVTGLLGCAVDVGAGDPAEAIRLDETIAPGGLRVGQVTPGSQVSIGDQPVRVSEDGRFAFGVGRDAEGTLDITVDLPDGEKVTRTLTIDQRDYHIQRIDGLPSRKVEPNKDDQAKIEADWILLNDAKGTDTDSLAFSDQAVWPVTGPQPVDRVQPTHQSDLVVARLGKALVRQRKLSATE